MTAADLSPLQQSLRDAYQLESELGGGGMSRVFVAVDAQLGRKVVVKVLPPELGAGRSAQRFTREIRLAASLQHPHIVPLLTAGSTADGLLYYTMPYVEGESLRERLARDGELPVGDALRILRDLFGALTYAHARGIVHCDVTPGNILLADGHALVTDFGIAHALDSAAAPDALTGSSGAHPIGTAAYMAPEQVAGDRPVDHRTDIYAAGAVAYALLTGRPPFGGITPLVIMAAQVTDEAEPLARRRPGVPRRVAALVHTCLQKRMEDRPQHAAEVLREIDALLMRPSGESGIRTETPRRRWHTAAVTGGALALIGAGGAAARKVYPRPAAATAAVARQSVAVLPFTDLAPATDSAYFAAGMADELTEALSHVEGLQVVSRASAATAGARTNDPREAGRALGVRTVLSGTVRRDGDRVRLTARLVDVATGYVLWSRAFERRITDVFEAQDALARSIAQTLQGHLVNRAPGDTLLVRRGTSDTEAYELYLKGRWTWNDRTEAGLRKALAYFEQALARDPTFALAQAGIADAWVLLPDYSDVPTSEAYPQAAVAASRALRMDSTLAGAHAALAVVHMYMDWDWPAAEREFHDALALEPNYATAHMWYANYLTTTGRLREALAEAQQAQTLDPLSRAIGAQVAQTLYLLRRFHESERWARETVGQDPTFAFGWNMLAQVLVQEGRDREAMAALDTALAVDGRSSLNLLVLGYAHARAGRRAEAERVIDELLARRAHQYVAPSIIGTIYSGLGDTDQTVRWLSLALDEKESAVTYLATDPVFDPVRHDPRFAALLRRIGVTGPGAGW